MPFQRCVSIPQLLPVLWLTDNQIIGAGVVNGHVGLKYLYVRIWRKNPQRMGQRDLVSVGSWVAIGLICWVIAWIIAEGIPTFSNLLSLISALFASWFSCKSPQHF